MGLTPVQYSSSKVITPPPPALANNLNTLLLNTQFNSLSTIDLANAQVAGPDWFLRHSWVTLSGTSSPERDTWLSFVDQVGSNLSIVQAVGGSLFSQFTPDVVGRINIASACYSTAGSGYVGNVFGPNFYVEINTNGLSTAGFGDLACFGFPIEFFTGDSSAANMVELDFFETGGGGTYHQGMVPWQWVSPHATNVPANGPFQINLPWTGDFTLIGCLKLSAAYVGLSNGIVDMFTNNVSVGGPFPFSMTGNYAASDQHHYVIMTNSPVANAINYIRVWGP